MKTTKTEATAYAVTPELNAAVESVHAALARRLALDSAVDTLPETIAGLEADAARLRGELGTTEAKLAMSAGAQMKELESACQTLTDSLSKKEIEIRRAKARVVALEGMAAEVDEAVQTAGTLLNQEVGFVAGDFKVEIAREMREAVGPVLEVLAKARAVGLGQFNDVFAAAYLPEIEGFMIVGGASNVSGEYIGTNLLDAFCNTPESDAIAAVLKPAKDALAAARSYRPYVPLAKRPAPYRIQGADWRGGQPTLPVIQKEVAPHGFATLKLNEPYAIKGDQSGALTRAAAGEQELSIGRVLTDGVVDKQPTSRA